MDFLNKQNITLVAKKDNTANTNRMRVTEDFYSWLKEKVSCKRRIDIVC